MIIKCIYTNVKDAFKGDELPSGYSSQTSFGFVELDKEFLVVGLLLGENHIDYLIDDGKYIVCYPSELFSIIDGKLPEGWFFRKISSDEEVYPYRQAIWGYYDLCFDDNHVDQLLNCEEEAENIYFKNKKLLYPNWVKEYPLSYYQE